MSPLVQACVLSVRLPLGSSVVRWNQCRLDELVEAVEVDVGEDGAHNPPLRCPAQGGVVRPFLQVPSLEQPLHQPQEAAVVDLLAEDRQHDRVVQTVEAGGDVSLHEPGSTRPRPLDLLKGRVAPSAWPKPVRARGELRLEVRLQDQADDFLQQSVRPDGNAEGALLGRVLLLDVDAPGWRPSVALEAQGLDDRIDVRQGHAVGRFGGDSRCQRPFVGGDPSKRPQVQLPVEQVPVDTLQRQPSAASVLDDSQQGCGALHYADLSLWVIETPASLRHVDGFPALGLLRRLRCPRARAP